MTGKDEEPRHSVEKERQARRAQRDGAPGELEARGARAQGRAASLLRSGGVPACRWRVAGAVPVPRLYAISDLLFLTVCTTFSIQEF